MWCELLPIVKRYLLYVFLAVFGQGLQATDVYRTVDENGRVHFSQFPPYKDAEKVQLKGSQHLNTPTQSNDQVNRQEQQKKYSNYLESERLERKERREKAKQEKAELKSKCHAIRADLEDIQQGGVQYYDLDENGNRVYVDENRVEAKKRRLKDYLSKNCKFVLND